MTVQPRRFAGSVACLTLLVATTTVVLALLPHPHANPIGGNGFLLGDIGFLLVPAVFSIVGWLIASRRPDTSIGWLCMAVGLLFTVVASASPGRWVSESHGFGELSRWFDALGSLWVPALGIAGTHLLLRLPNGDLPSTRWRPYSISCTVIIALTFVLVTVPGADTFGSLFLLLPLSFVGALASLVIRFRRARGLERVQLRWIALGGGFFLAAYLPNLLVLFGLVTEGSGVADAIQTFSFAAFSAVPIAIGVAVLRYRLYEIDRILNRAAVYAVLTATLAAAYLASVLVLQLALSGLTRDSGIAVAGSTLAVAALFRPARARIQQVVDRRFYRARYDARQTVEAFTTRLRDQVDLAALETDLGAVVSRTVRPTHMSLWLRERP